MILYATVTGGTPLILSSLDVIGFPRIHESLSATYLHGEPHGLLRSTDGLTFTECGNGTTVRALAEDQTGEITNIVAFGVSTTQTTGTFYHAEPVTSSGWIAGGSLPSAFLAVDAVNDSDNIVGIVVGNSHAGVEPRIERGSQIAPYSFADSSSGIPASTSVTDLEV